MFNIVNGCGYNEICSVNIVKHTMLVVDTEIRDATDSHQHQRNIPVSLMEQNIGGKVNWNIVKLVS